MRIQFDASAGTIVVLAHIVGPRRHHLVKLALDTGASQTLIAHDSLVVAGYQPTLAVQRRQMTIASGVESVPLLNLEEFAALGLHRNSFQVVCHTLPPSATVDGLLGLDFLRGTVLTINFREGWLEIDR